MNEDIEFIKDVIHRMNTQDNRCTAAPYYYQIEDEEEVPTSSDYSDKYTWVYDCEEYTDAEAREIILDAEPNSFDSDKDFDEILEDYEFEKVYCLTKKVYKGLFLTEDSAKEHLRLNRYHYGENARTYVFHAWRNPELKKFIESVARLVDMEYKPKGSR